MNQQKCFDVVKQSTPLGRSENPVEVGHLAAYLCSDVAGFVTGATIHIDGGLRLGKL